MKNRGVVPCCRWIVRSLTALLLIIAFVLTVSRVSLVILAQYPEYVEKWASIALKQPVQIQSMEADWMALDPGMTFHNVLVKDVNGQPSFIQMKRMTISIDILRSLLHWKLLPGRLIIDGVNLDIDHQAYHFQVRGILSSMQDLQLSDHSVVLTDLVNWMLSEGNVDIHNISVNYHAKDRKIYTVRNVHLRVKNNFFTHRIWGGAMINTVSPTEIRFAARLDNIDFSDAKFDATVYLQFRGIQLAQWANSNWLKPYGQIALVKGGNADFEIWANWHKTTLTHVESRWHIQQAKVLLPSSKQSIEVSDLSANLIWHPSSHTIDLESKRLIFSLPGVYASPLHLHNLNIQFLWNTDPFGFHLYVPSYQFSLIGLNSHGECYLTLPPTGKPTLDLLSNIQLSHFTALPALIPNVRQGSSSYAWLHQAFLKGDIPNATVAYRGSIQIRPFQHHDAHLSAEFQVRDASFRYYFGWPMLSSLNTTIHVNNRQISAHFINPILDGQHIDVLAAHLSNFMQPVLAINGILHSDIRNVYRFMQHSPIVLKAAPNGPPLKGPIALNLKMSIDFTRPLFPVQGQGEANIIGSLLKFQMHTGDSIVHFNMNGAINLDPIAKQLHVNLLKGVSGKTHYNAALTIYEAKGNPKTLDADFTTNMKGITRLGFPKFIDKNSVDLNTMKLHIVVYHKKPIRVTLHYRNNIFMRLFASHQNHHITLLSGEVYIGQQPSPTYPAFPGFFIYGKMTNLKWGVWEPFIMPLIHEKNGAIDIPKIFGLPLRYVDVQVDQLDAYHFIIHHMNFKLVPRPHDWMFQMTSPEVSGLFFIPNHSGGTWAGHLDHLLLPQMKIKKSMKKQKPLTTDPRKLPPINLEIKQLYYGKVNYGHLELLMQPARYGIVINKLLIASPLLTVKISGNWNQGQHFQTTELSGLLRTTNLGQFLSGMSTKNSLMGGQGWSSFQLSWFGAPNIMTLEKLSGHITFDFRHGRILKMEEGKSTELSIGRIINLFSLENLPHSLSSGFRNITEKGLEFHQLEGYLTIKYGVCRVKNTLLDSPVAKLKINGIINFPRKYYNLDVSVSPYVTSSVPLIVGIAGGPIAGAIAWIANKIATPEIGKMVGFVYHAQGSWDTSKNEKLPIPAETHILIKKEHHDRPY